MMSHPQSGTDSSLASPDENISPNSCANCNRSHRKCDRKLPICSECSKKNKVCIYEAPKRVKKNHDKKQDKTRYQPYPTKDGPTPPQNFKFHQHEPKREKPPSPVASFSSLEQIMSVLPNNQHDVGRFIPALERYFEQVYLNTPLFDRSKFDSINTYRQRLLGENVPINTSEIPDKEDMVLVFAMQGKYNFIFIILTINSIFLLSRGSTRTCKTFS
jgi:hypothetical protein